MFRKSFGSLAGNSRAAGRGIARVPRNLSKRLSTLIETIVITVFPLGCRSSETTFIEMTAPSSATRDVAGVSKKPPRSNGSVLNFKSLKEV